MLSWLHIRDKSHSVYQAESAFSGAITAIENNASPLRLVNSCGSGQAQPPDR
jgi:hypothetical protein